MRDISDIGVLFDLDGVLVDTEGLYSEFWTEMGEKRYPTGIPDFANVIKGNTLEVILDTHFPDKAIQDDIVAHLKEYEANMPYKLFDGVKQLLDELKRMGVPCAIVTSSGPVKMGMLFDRIPGFRTYFDVVLTDADITRSKPDPQGYLMAADAIQRDIRNCFVFEDSLAGTAAGMASGATTVAIASTNPEHVLAGRAHVVYRSIAEVDLNDILKMPVL